MRDLLILLLCCFGQQIFSQADWQLRAPMPMPTANNAVCAAQVDGDDRVYSFGGIGVGLDRLAIHRRAYRYSTLLDAWTTLPEIPDTSGKIASAASVVGGVAYVIGGYHVLNASPFEISSNKVHRFDLSTETWLTDGAPIPIPIDDQVQAVWRDSLIYVITGWSNTTNVSAVQVYDPALDTWSVGTAVINSNAYRAFGASGTIIGDTIFYYGGASMGSSFPAQDKLRIGVIDPLSPLTIQWLPAVNTGRASYRSGCGTLQNRPFWVGGSSVSYNYDAEAYNGSGVVAPATDLAILPNTNAPFSLESAGAEVMDLRGVGQLSSGDIHICGGIGPNAEVSATNWLITTSVGIGELDATAPRIFPVPSSGSVTVDLPQDLFQGRYAVYNTLGAMVLEGRIEGPRLQLEMADRPRGTYTVELIGTGRVLSLRFWLV